MNENQFVSAIENSPNKFVYKMDRAINQNYIIQLSRPMLVELSEIYKLVNPQYNIKMLNMSCNSCILTFVKEVGRAYLKAKEVQPIVITGEDMTSDLDDLSNEDVVIKEEAPVIPKKKGRPFSKNLPK